MGIKYLIDTADLPTKIGVQPVGQHGNDAPLLHTSRRLVNAVDQATD